MIEEKMDNKENGEWEFHYSYCSKTFNCILGKRVNSYLVREPGCDEKLVGALAQ